MSERIVWLHTYGDIKKLAACHVKQFKLVDKKAIKNRYENEDIADNRQVMLEDGL